MDILNALNTNLGVLVFASGVVWKLISNHFEIKQNSRDIVLLKQESQEFHKSLKQLIEMKKDIEYIREKLDERAVK